MEAVMANRTNQDRVALSVRWVPVAAKSAPPAGRWRTEKSSGQQSQGLRRQALCDRDESDPDRCAVELVQRGRLILDVSVADLEAAEATFGAFHSTTWYFRNTLNEARRSWDRLRAELGSKVLEAALRQPPLMTLTLGEAAGGETKVILALIAGQTYQLQPVTGTELAPVQWRLARLNGPVEHGPYFACRLADGSTQCDCADWTYQIAQTDCGRRLLCKHLAALMALGWI
jgi:hypothetical protein